MASDGPKVAIVGAGGMLGRELARAFPGASLFDSQVRDGLKYVNLCNVASVIDALSDFRPGDWVVNAAAYTGVDAAEVEPGLRESFHANWRGPKVLAAVAAEQGLRIAHISTAYVFDGTLYRPHSSDEGLYVETDAPNPINAYGRHKMRGEKPMLEAGAVVLRTDVLYGAGKGNFIDTMERLSRANAERGTALPVVVDQIRSPTYCADLAGMVRSVVELDGGVAPGIYHAVNTGGPSRVEVVEAIMDTIGARCDLERLSTDTFNARFMQGKSTAPQPGDVSLNNGKLQLALGGTYSIRPWRAALVDYLTHK
jgi:dTDP-4-dehydrorhamnose reductase